MPYTPTTWVNDSTPLSAANMNNLETGVQEAIPKAISGVATDKVPVYDGTNWVAQKIVNAQIDAAAAIAHSKILVPACRVYHSVDQSLATGGNAALTFNSERFDNDAIHDTGTNPTRLTCKTAGKYLIAATLRFAQAGGGTFRQTFFKVNGTTSIATDLRLPSASQDIDVTISTIWDMAVNDYVELFAGQDSGGAINIKASSAQSPEFMMVKVA
jgi:hypothetical protein